jgi:hypothetical protein
MMRRAIRILCVMLLCSGPGGQAQEVLMGTIEKLDQDNGSLTISGQVLPFSDAITQVYLEDRLISPGKIDLGMVVRYTLDASGTLLRIELIGPSDKLTELQRN